MHVWIDRERETTTDSEFENEIHRYVFTEKEHLRASSLPQTL